GHMNSRNDLARSSMKLAGTEGEFQKTTLDLYHIQKFTDRLSMHASFIGQYAWTNLDSSEKFYTAGYHGVRAFPQGEYGGDHGLVASAELRWATGNPHWQLAAFYDLGWAKNRNGSIAGDDSRTLAGAGIGVIWTSNKNSYARMDYAFPLTDRMSNTYGHDIVGTVWFQFVQKI
nr:BamA/TamA family outer membrane protein [Schwartzia sp. (in: firmicutes)]